MICRRKTKLTTVQREKLKWQLSQRERWNSNQMHVFLTWLCSWSEVLSIISKLFHFWLTNSILLSPSIWSFPMHSGNSVNIVISQVLSLDTYKPYLNEPNVGTPASYLTSPVLNFHISKLETVLGTKLLHRFVLMIHEIVHIKCWYRVGAKETFHSGEINLHTIQSPSLSNIQPSLCS